MTAWLHALASAPTGARKLTGFILALVALFGVLACSLVALWLLPAESAGEVPTVAGAACVALAALYVALCGGNAAEHRHRARARSPDGP